jgi:hypothetical protein
MGPLLSRVVRQHRTLETRMQSGLARASAHMLAVAFMHPETRFVCVCVCVCVCVVCVVCVLCVV